MRGSVRLVLLLNAAAVSVLSAALLLGLGLPLLRDGLDRGVAATVQRFGWLVLADGILNVMAWTLVLFQSIARPVDRLLVAARALGGPPDGGQSLPLLGDPEGGLLLPGAALAFERAVDALAAERAQLAAKVDELTRANSALGEARASLQRSERLATVGRLAAGIAHEVGNPLGAVTGYLELVRSRLGRGDGGPELGEVNDYLTRISGEVGRIDHIIRELLDFSRSSPPRLAPVDLARAVDGAVRLARVQPRFRSVTVDLDIPAGLSPVVADEHPLTQVLLNLLLNAGDAMAGEGSLAIAARREDGRVSVSFADSGPGMAPADLPRVFDPFFTTKDPGQGTGLGLAISHRIMESFGGEIAAANRPGGGALFTLTFKVE